MRATFGNWSLNFRDDLCEANSAIFNECEGCPLESIYLQLICDGGSVPQE